MLVLGRLVIWALQTSGLLSPIWERHWILTELRECDYCLGVWIFAGLAAILRVNLLEPDYFPVVSETITGIAASFAVHLARVGWNTKFQVLDLTEE